MSVETGRTQYVLTHGTHGRFENNIFAQYGLGDKIALTDKEAEALKGRVQLAEVSDAQEPTPVEKTGSVSEEESDAGGSTGAESEWSFLDGLHHVKAVELVRGLDDPEQVQAVLDYELAHKNRPSVTFAAKDRLKEIAAAGVENGSGSDEDEG